MNIFIAFLGKLGPPVFAATLVGCLLANQIKLIHIILMGVGMGAMLLEGWYHYRKENKKDSSST